MSNQDRAAQLITGLHETGFHNPQDLAKYLDDAGLLAPELPKPDLLSRHGWPRWEITNFGNTKETVYVDYMRGGVFINVPACNMSANPEDVAAFALAVLAAANYTEEA
jgi:hypothetical protein|nr:MAG TPA: hypothetical protein [Caudoviricetes sp.]